MSMPTPKTLEEFIDETINTEEINGHDLVPFIRSSLREAAKLTVERVRPKIAPSKGDVRFGYFSALDQFDEQRKAWMEAEPKK